MRSDTVDSNVVLDGKYALVMTEDMKKPVMAKLRVSSKSMEAVPQDKYSIAGVSIPITIDDVVCVYMSPHPKTGVAYGVRTSPLYDHIRVPHWGKVYLYRDLTSSEKDKIIDGLSSAYSKIKSVGLSHLLPIDIEVRPNVAKYAGRWIKTRNRESGETETRIEICPESIVALDAKSMRHIILHEFGHEIWNSPDFTTKLKAKWIGMYHSSLRLTTITMDDVKSLREGLASQSSTITAFRRELADDAMPLFDACIKWTTTHHSVSRKHLDTLLSDGDDLSSYWPSSRIHTHQLIELVTEYAKKAPEELHSEAMAIHMAGGQLQEPLAKLARRTVRALQTVPSTK